MTGSGIFPKSDGDIFYGTDANRCFTSKYVYVKNDIINGKLFDTTNVWASEGIELDQNMSWCVLQHTGKIKESLVFGLYKYAINAPGSTIIQTVQGGTGISEGGGGIWGAVFNTATNNFILSWNNESLSKIYTTRGMIPSSLSVFDFTATNYCRDIAIDSSGNLLSLADGNHKIYVHNGVSNTITTSFTTPSTQPSGITFDGTNLISCDSLADKIYVHSGVTSTITTSFATPDTDIHNLAYDSVNGNLYCLDSTGIIYKMSGVTATVTSSWTSPHTGICFANGMLYCFGGSTTDLYYNIYGTETLVSALTAGTILETAIAKASFPWITIKATVNSGAGHDSLHAVVFRYE